MLVKTMSTEVKPEDEMKVCIGCKKLKLASTLKNDLCPECFKLSTIDLPIETETKTK
jgi:hypothetical protein